VDVGYPVAQVAIGARNTCVVMERGSVRCWGLGNQGLLGNGSSDDIGDDEPASASQDACIEGFETSCP
jgi:hypothetical protein